MQGGLACLPYYIRLGKRNSQIIISNVIIALVLNFILIFSASLEIISPAAGAVGHQASTGIVLLNSLRLVPAWSNKHQVNGKNFLPFGQ